jgi:hypothetical protein
MGVAAYNRGSDLIRREIDAEMRPVEYEIMDRLNSIPKIQSQGGGKVSGPLIIKQDPNGNAWWLLDPEKKFDGFGYFYKTLKALMERWDIQIVGYDATKDEWSVSPI